MLVEIASDIANLRFSSCMMSVGIKSGMTNLKFLSSIIM
jgi:hypothetical protein